MSAIKYFVFGGAIVFAAVAFIGYIKKPLVVESEENKSFIEEVSIPPLFKKEAVSDLLPQTQAKKNEENKKLATTGLPEADRVDQLFVTDSSKLGIVETISYTSRAPWVQGRPAWIADYASHYNTSRHFIARSLNKKPDYFTQKASPGARFNVFKKDKKLQFYLLADLSRCRLWFYYIDLDQNERVLLKTYSIGVGRVNQKKQSGYMTPIGKYSIGDKIAIYKPGVTGFFHDEQIEMISVFGTRWIPLDQDIEGCTEPARGLGLHGAPWIKDSETKLWREDREKIGVYDSDGCIRLLSEDIEELFSIVITKPTVIELVKDFNDAKLPGFEREPL